MGKLDYLKRYETSESSDELPKAAATTEVKKQPDPVVQEAEEPVVVQEAEEPVVQEEAKEEVTYRLGLKRVSKAEWEEARKPKKRQLEKKVELSEDQKKLLSDQSRPELRSEDPLKISSDR